MNTRTIKGKSLGILLSLALVLSMVAVAVPTEPVYAATVTVDAPNGGEAAKGGGNYLVSWTQHHTGPALVTATIAISIDNGSNWTDLTSVSGLGTGSYSHTVAMPNANSTQCLIRVTVAGPDDPSVSDTSDAVFTLDNTPPTVTLGSPLGAECWVSASNRNIIWSAIDNFSGNLTYQLQYSTNGGTSWANVTPPYSDAQGAKSYAWNPIVSANSNNCKVRVTATDLAGNFQTVTSGTFTIDGANPTVIVQQPNGSEILNAGATYDIKWIASDTILGNLTYKLEYSINGCAGPYTTIGSPFSGAQGSQTYNWTVPGVKSANCCIRVTATDCTGVNSGSDTSDATFTIQDTTPPNVTVTSPNGGESWRAGSPQTITWTATDNVPGNLNYYLYYCTNYNDCTSCNLPIAGPLNQPQGARSYAWTVPTPVPPATSNQCRVKVVAIDTATTPNSASDCSNNNFTIIVSSASAVNATLNSPNGGETWQGGTSKTISWTASSDIPTETLTITLEYWNGSWNLIATLPNRAQGAGSFQWSVPDDTAITKVRVTATAGSLSKSDESDNVFTVTPADSGLLTASITLYAGWNLISLELIPTSTSPDTILSNALSRVISVWYYTGGASGTWQSWAPGAPSSLSTLTDGKAYWVYLTPGANVTVSYQGRKGPVGGGFPTTPYNYPAGWNMVGFKSTIAKTVATYLGGTCGTTYLAPLYCWNAAAQDWCSPSPGCTDNMNPDSGYWVYFNTAHTVNAAAD